MARPVRCRHRRGGLGGVVSPLARARRPRVPGRPGDRDRRLRPARTKPRPGGRRSTLAGRGPGDRVSRRRGPAGRPARERGSLRRARRDAPVLRTGGDRADREKRPGRGAPIAAIRRQEHAGPPGRPGPRVPPRVLRGASAPLVLRAPPAPAAERLADGQREADAAGGRARPGPGSTGAGAQDGGAGARAARARARRAVARSAGLPAGGLPGRGPGARRALAHGPGLLVVLAPQLLRSPGEPPLVRGAGDGGDRERRLPVRPGGRGGPPADAARCADPPGPRGGPVVAGWSSGRGERPGGGGCPGGDPGLHGHLLRSSGGCARPEPPGGRLPPPRRARRGRAAAVALQRRAHGLGVSGGEAGASERAVGRRAAPAPPGPLPRAARGDPRTAGGGGERASGRSTSSSSGGPGSPAARISWS